MKKLLILLLCTACATTPKKGFDDYLKEGQCAEALKNFPGEDSSILKQTKYLSGNAASYALTGLSYGAQVTLYVVGGVVGGVVICSPILLAESASHGTGLASGQCFETASHALMKTGLVNNSLGDDVYKNTEHWRCPDLTDFSENLRSIATCYENKNDQDNLKKAQEQLDAIRSRDFQLACLSDKERTEILGQYSRISKKLEQK